MKILLILKQILSRHTYSLEFSERATETVGSKSRLKINYAAIYKFKFAKIDS